MQPAVKRAESRSRRSHSVDPPLAASGSRPRRTPSSSRIDLSPSPGPSPHTTPPSTPPPTSHLMRSISVIAGAYALAFALSQSTTPTLAALALPALAAAAAALLPLARPSLTVLRRALAYRPARALMLLAVLHVAALMLLCGAVGTLGPVRAVIATAAQPAATRLLHGRRARPSSTSLLALTATALLALDAAGHALPHAAPALAVRRRVLQSNAAHAVHARLSTLRDGLSDRLRNHSSLAGSLSVLSRHGVRYKRQAQRAGVPAADRARRRDAPNAPLRPPPRAQREGAAVRKQEPDPPRQPEPPKQPAPPAPPANSERQRPSRRRLLSIVKPDAPQEASSRVRGNDTANQATRDEAPKSARVRSESTAARGKEPSSVHNVSTNHVQHAEHRSDTEDHLKGNSTKMRNGNRTRARRARPQPAKSSTSNSSGSQSKIVHTDDKRVDPRRPDSNRVASGQSRQQQPDSAVGPAQPQDGDRPATQPIPESPEQLGLSEPTPLGAILAVVQAILSAGFTRTSTELVDRLSSEPRELILFNSLAFLLGSALLVPVLILQRVQAVTISGDTFFPPYWANSLPLASLVGLTALVLPVLLTSLRRPGSRKTSPHSRTPKPAVPNVWSIIDASLLRPYPMYLPSPTWLFSVLLCAMAANYACNVQPDLDASAFTAPTMLAAILLLVVSSMDARRASSDRRRGRGMTRDRPLMGSSGDLSSHLKVGTVFIFSHAWGIVHDTVVNVLRAMADLGIHARSNRASWQVLNFLVLQSGMAVTELIYASATHSTGLFSISADNFFCSIALAVGLLAIRFSTRSPSLEFSYGYSRIESVCGFANGIMLIYVALLVVLEAFERISQDGNTALGRAFSVCLFGIVGNALGLYFFPPETRRENHNVQGIYLHICANTLAFFSVAISTMTAAVLPEWWVIDFATAVLVALAIVAFSMPLIIRSARLLLLMVSVEQEEKLKMVEGRLADIPGVALVSGLRVWNLTPTYMHASVRLEMIHNNEEQDFEVLTRARACFATMKIPASQCAIQISSYSSGRSDPPVLVHRRHRPEYPDPTLDINPSQGP